MAQPLSPHQLNQINHACNEITKNYAKFCHGKKKRVEKHHPTEIGVWQLERLMQSLPEYGVKKEGDSVHRIMSDLWSVICTGSHTIDRREYRIFIVESLPIHGTEGVSWYEDGWHLRVGNYIAWYA